MGHRILRVLPDEDQSNHISHANSPQLKLFYIKCECLLPCLLCRCVVQQFEVVGASHKALADHL